MSELDVNRSKSKVSMMKSTTSRSQMGMRSFSRLRVRKASFGFSGVPGIRPVERTSQVAIECKRPLAIYLPTYQLETRNPFYIPLVRKATEDVINEYFEGHKYNVQESPAIALRIAGEVMRKVKAMQFNRYRVITVVTIFQRRAQCYNNSVSFLWDHERDSYVDVNRELNTAFIQVTTFEFENLPQYTKQQP